MVLVEMKQRQAQQLPVGHICSIYDLTWFDGLILHKDEDQWRILINN